MTDKEKIDMIVEELQCMRQRISLEYNINFATFVGAIECFKYELFDEGKEENE